MDDALGASQRRTTDRDRVQLATFSDDPLKAVGHGFEWYGYSTNLQQNEQQPSSMKVEEINEMVGPQPVGNVLNHGLLGDGVGCNSLFGGQIDMSTLMPLHMGQAGMQLNQQSLVVPNTMQMLPPSMPSVCSTSATPSPFAAASQMNSKIFVQNAVPMIQQQQQQSIMQQGTLLFPNNNADTSTVTPSAVSMAPGGSFGVAGGDCWWMSGLPQQTSEHGQGQQSQEKGVDCGGGGGGGNESKAAAKGCLGRPRRRMRKCGSDSTLPMLDRKRQDRNAREQQRSFKITKQIENLRILLEANGVQVKSNKSSVLSAMLGYMGELQNRLEQLDVERKRWISESCLESDAIGIDGMGMEVEKNSVDFKQVFLHGCVGMAVATVEGRLVNCNKRFEELSGYTKAELSQLTLLNLTAPSELQETFRLLAVMLTDTSGQAPKEISLSAILKNKTTPLSLSLSLARDRENRPKFFLGTLVPNMMPTTGPLEEAAISAGPMTLLPLKTRTMEGVIDKREEGLELPG